MYTFNSLWLENNFNRSPQDDRLRKGKGEEGGGGFVMGGCEWGVFNKSDPKIAYEVAYSTKIAVTFDPTTAFAM